jgi:hypothetical protein
VAFASSVSNGRQACASDEQGSSGSGESSTGLRSNLHVCLQKGFIKDAPTIGREISRPTDLHPRRITLEFGFGYTASKFILSTEVFTQYLQRIGCIDTLNGVSAVEFCAAQSHFESNAAHRKAFSSEVDAGSRQENASNKK